MVMFSIITICHNEVTRIEKTILSVTSQTCRDYELIVIDGGSTDGTADIIRKYGHLLTYWISEPDGGVYEAMNKGVRHSTGEYVVFMNAGDRFFDNRVLERVRDYGLKADVAEGYVIRDDNKKRLRERYDDRYIQIFTDALSHQGTFTRRTLLESHPYDESLKIVSDWKFCLQTLIIEKCTYQFLPINIAYYDMTGISTIDESARIAEREKVLHEYFPSYVVEGIHSYFDVCTHRLVKYAIYLHHHNRKAYNLARKIVKRIYKLVKIFETI